MKAAKMSFTAIKMDNTTLTWLYLATHFAILHMYDTPTFKTEALHLVSKKRAVKCHLLLKSDLP